MSPKQTLTAFFGFVFLSALVSVDVAFAQEKPQRDFRPRKLMTPRKAIVSAKFIAASAVTNQVSDADLVIGVVVNGQARAYPINMLTGPSREIINDNLGGRSIAATW